MVGVFGDRLCDSDRNVTIGGRNRNTVPLRLMEFDKAAGGLLPNHIRGVAQLFAIAGEIASHH